MIEMKKDKVGSISVILPCAFGSDRLKGPYSRELVKIDEDMVLIDSSFKHILASYAKPRVVIVIEDRKSDTVRYLRGKYDKKVDLVFVFQKHYHNDLFDVIRSAKHLFSDKNIILMPNGIIEYKDKKNPLIDRISGALEDCPFVFVCKKELSISRLKLSAALHIEDEKVVEYQYKPTKDFKKFNAFSVSFGFTKEFFDEAVEVLGQAANKKSNSFDRAFKKSAIYESSSVMVSDYTEINTWTNLNAYLLKRYLIESGVDPQFLKMYQ